MIIDLEQALHLKKKNFGKKIVFTNGCFDILTKAHCLYLTQAKKLGEILIVGLNSDSSVRRLKGKERPINKQEDRAEVLDSLKSVDYVVIFDDDDVTRLFEIIKPEIWVKGGDYTLETINQKERKTAEALGIKIQLMKNVEGVSTTKIIEKIRRE